MAEALMKARLEDAGLEGWQVESAGTWASEGIEATDNAALVMQERGLDLFSHCSRRVTEEIMQVHDLILVMTESHKEALQVEFPQYKEKIFLMSEMLGENWDIEDPVGQSIEEYRATADAMDQILADGFEQILITARRNSEIAV
jgi:protein-tyrosine-phosphatase